MGNMYVAHCKGDDQMNILLYIWQLPQHILALIFIGMLKLTKQLIGNYPINDVKMYVTKLNLGICLGQYIILSQWMADTEGSIFKHETGHSIQSKRLGWFYLIFVGIPSVLRNLYLRIGLREIEHNAKQGWYYLGWPERQADILGGVERKF